MLCKFLLPKILGSVCGLLLTGCLMEYEAPQDTEPADVTLKLNIEASGVLAKGSHNIFRCAVVLLTSNKGDTLVDSITSEGSSLSREPVFLFESPEKQQSFTLHYALSPHRQWSVRVRLYDEHDFLQQADSSQLGKLKPFEDRRVELRLRPRFAFYLAQFFLPSQVSLSKQGGWQNRKVFFTRLRVQNGGKVLQDTVSAQATGGFFEADPGYGFGIPVTDDYAGREPRTYTLSAYGLLEGDTLGVTPERLLFRGLHTVTAAETVDPKAFLLDWQSQENGAAREAGSEDAVRLGVVLGPIGKIVMHVETSGAVDF